MYAGFLYLKTDINNGAVDEIFCGIFDTKELGEKMLEEYNKQYNEKSKTKKILGYGFKKVQLNNVKPYKAI